MKRAIDCVRDTIMLIEENDGKISFPQILMLLPDYEEELIKSSCKFLEEQGYIEVLIAKSLDNQVGNIAGVTDITKSGKNFLELVRDPVKWNNIAENIQ